MRNIESYVIDIESEIDEISYDLNGSRPLAFLEYVRQNFAERLSLQDVQLEYIAIKSKNGNYLGECFGYSVSTNQEVLTLLYSLYEPSITQGIVKNYTRSDIERCTNRLQGLYKYCENGAILETTNQDSIYHDLHYKLSDKKCTLSTVRLVVMCNGTVVADLLNNPIKIKIKGHNVKAEVVDIYTLESYAERNSDHREIDVKFGTGEDEFNYRLPAIEVRGDCVDYKCYTTVFPAKLLRKLYAEYNTDLLIGNVRYYLGLKGKKDKNANVGMLDTLRHEKHMFMAYNNGIVALAREVDAEYVGEACNLDPDRADLSNVGIIKRINDFQIVNGGQTTAVIYNAKNLGTKDSINLLGVYVPIKIIVIGDNTENRKKIAANVSRYSNSQSKIKWTDFSSSSDFNMTLEEISKNTNTPAGHKWFFERLRGQFDAERALLKNKQDQDAFNRFYSKKDRTFGKEELGQVWQCYHDVPYDVVKGKMSNYEKFLKRIDDSHIMPDVDYFKKSVALLIIWRYINSIPHVRQSGNKRSPIIAYTLSFLVNHIRLSFNLIRVWNEQRISSELADYLFKLSQKIAESLERIASEENDTVLSASKRESTYKEICNRGIHSHVDLIKSYFIS